MSEMQASREAIIAIQNAMFWFFELMGIIHISSFIKLAVIIMNKKYRDCSLQLCIFICTKNLFSDVKKNDA